MSNSRIKDSPIEGVKEEAIATTITMLYDPINPANTTISFAYKSFLTNEEGEVLPYTDEKYDLISMKLSDTMEWDLGEGLSVLDVVAGIRAATDIAHNNRATQDVVIS